jgi:hypothetical protein
MVASTFFVFANNQITEYFGATNNTEHLANAKADQVKELNDEEKNKKIEDEQKAEEELDKQQAENKKKNTPEETT